MLRLRSRDDAALGGLFFGARTGVEGGAGTAAGVAGMLMPQTDRERTDAPRIDDSRELASGSTCRETLFAGGATEGLAGAAEGPAGTDGLAAEGLAGAGLVAM